MIWRAPWLQSRLHRGSLALWDSLSLLALYQLIYGLRLGALPGVTGGLIGLECIWVFGSYLLGRYSEQTWSDEQKSWRSFKKIIFIALLMLSLMIGDSWIRNIVDSQVRFRGFLLPLTTLMMVSSGLADHLLAAKKRAALRWVLIGSITEQKILHQELLEESPATQASTVLLVSEDQASVNREIQAAQRANSRHSTVKHGFALSEQGDLPSATLNQLLELRSRGVHICSMIDWAEHTLHRVPPELLSQAWLVKADGFRLAPGTTSWRSKRLIDVIGALGLLTLSAPILTLAATLIWLEDRGPIFYSQLRTGLGGKPFWILKLRTMRPDAEAGQGALWALKGDSRITTVGQWLRRLRLDELPQLLSVIRGEMSLIGPRPERPEIESTLESKIPHYRVRQWLRPGLSGWAQVCFPYGASVSDSRTKLCYDIYYLRHAGLLLDLLITIKTIRLVSRARGSVPRANT